MSEQEQIVQLTEEEQDAKWRESLLPELRPVAERHGRKLYVYCFSLNGMQDTLNMLMHIKDRGTWLLQGANARAGSKEFHEGMSIALRMTELYFNTLAIGLMTEAKFPINAVNECRQDIARAAELSRASMPPANSSGIILPS